VPKTSLMILPPSRSGGRSAPRPFHHISNKTLCVIEQTSTSSFDDNVHPLCAYLHFPVSSLHTSCQRERKTHIESSDDKCCSYTCSAYLTVVSCYLIPSPYCGLSLFHVFISTIITVLLLQSLIMKTVNYVPLLKTHNTIHCPSISASPAAKTLAICLL
jgi:hypothetical protein